MKPDSRSSPRMQTPVPSPAVLLRPSVHCVESRRPMDIFDGQTYSAKEKSEETGDPYHFKLVLMHDGEARLAVRHA
ncbi:hypothetical protein EVG20_g2304 [Dentipellis fragilis]|uniref:Uncharacterized protein n=1 Tax=Dentipellis fragilis TaxID=205917 RepID=A0A4Y9Z981_9AGAM|nr:hypothetical protein EVG20_g2304 [Dentipellis fragilis]